MSVVCRGSGFVIGAGCAGFLVVLIWLVWLIWVACMLQMGEEAVKSAAISLQAVGEGIHFLFWDILALIEWFLHWFFPFLRPTR